MSCGEERIRVVKINEVVEIYKDPDTETQLEGHAFVWDVQREDEQFFELVVSFLADPYRRRVLRKYRKTGR